MKDRMTLEQVVAIVGVSEAFVATLEREFIVERTDLHFTVAQVDRIRVCWNLHNELGVNLAGIEVALGLLERLETRQREHRRILERLLGDRDAD